MNSRNLISLMLLISFGSIGAVACSPALPEIAKYFLMTESQTQSCISWYLIGYAFGQLIYGPLVNRYGSKNSIIIGVLIEIIGAIICILSKYTHSFELLLIGRVLMAIGAGSGLTLALTISSRLSAPQQSAKTISILTIAFAVTPGIGVFLGGWLLNFFDWTSSFYLLLAYGVLIWILSYFLPEAIQTRNPSALQLSSLGKNYLTQLRSSTTIFGGLLIGSSTSIIYSFAALAPFMAIDLMKITPSSYGTYNFIPVIGMIAGSLAATYLSKSSSSKNIIKVGLIIATVGSITMFFSLNLFPQMALSLFAPMLIIYFGLSIIFSNGSALALSHTVDKSNASAMLSFINMSLTVAITSLFGLIGYHGIWLIPIVILTLLGLSGLWFWKLLSALKNKQPSKASCNFQINQRI